MVSRLNEEIRKKEAPIVVGLDPKPEFIPEAVKNRAYEEFGETAEGVAESFFLFNEAIIDAVCDLVPAVKPQIAMYEQFGIPGLEAFDRTVRYAKEKGLIVVGDAKRGDIGSTSASYAEAHLGGTMIGNKMVRAFDEDFVTVNPYLGSDGVKPFIEVAKREGKGIFVLVKTSNPSSGELQDLIARDSEGKERPIYETVGALVDEWGSLAMDGDYSDVGAVVGATYPEQGAVLRKIMKRAVILVPGYGAQGGKGSDLKPFFNEDGLGALVNSSRGIIAAWREERYSKYGADAFADASRAAVIAMREDLRQAYE